MRKIAFWKAKVMKKCTSLNLRGTIRKYLQNYLKTQGVEAVSDGNCVTLYEEFYECWTKSGILPKQPISSTR